MTMRAVFRRKLVLPTLALAMAGVLATAAGAANGPTPPETKAGSFTIVVADIKAGKAKKLGITKKHTAGVWDGCRFHYLTTDNTDWQFDDGSIASVSDNPEPFVPGECATPHNPTPAEMAESEQKTNAANAAFRPPGAPPAPPTPADWYNTNRSYRF
jgi:hypothetical protein